MGKFQPGQSGNPGGQPKVSEELRKHLKITGLEILHIIAKYARMRVCDAQEAVQNKELPLLDHVILKNLLDYNKLFIILERCIGKVPDRVEVTGTIGELLEEVPTEQLLKVVNG